MLLFGFTSAFRSNFSAVGPYYDVTFDTGLEIRDARWEPASSPCAAAARRRDFISTVLELMPSHKCPSLGRRSAPLQSRDATRPAPRSTLYPPSRHPRSVLRCDLNSPLIWYSGECSTLRVFSQFKLFCKTWKKCQLLRLRKEHKFNAWYLEWTESIWRNQPRIP